LSALKNSVRNAHFGASKIPHLPQKLQFIFNSSLDGFWAVASRSFALFVEPVKVFPVFFDVLQIASGSFQPLGVEQNDLPPVYLPFAGGSFFYLAIP